MRRISDGRAPLQTTEQLERAFVEDQDYQFLYADGEGFTFMNGENFEQVTVPKDVVGDQAPYLQENMTVRLSLYDGVPIAIELPQRVTLEVVETEPTMKGQTASSSYKPAVLSNGVRSARPHRAGTRIVVMTEDGSLPSAPGLIFFQRGRVRGCASRGRRCYAPAHEPARHRHGPRSCSVGVAIDGRPPVLRSETIGRGHADGCSP
jgi:elongation factor P